MKRRTKPAGAYEGREDDFQRWAILLVRTIAATYGVDPRAVMHVPNGGMRNPIVAKRMKAQGVVAGYPDIMVFAQSAMKDHDVSTWGQFCCGLALEMKVWPNKATAEQEAIHDLLRDSGWRVAVCYGLAEVEREVNEYFM